MPVRLTPHRLTAVLLAAAALAGGASMAGADAQDNGAPPGVAPGGILRSTQTTYRSIVAHAGPAIVQIETSSGLGSGVVCDNRGDIVTNAHVVGSARRVRVTLATGRTYGARVLGIYRPNDLAVVRLDRATPVPATFGSSRQLRVGDIVLAIGNPLGLRSSVTNGIVSALGRTLTEQDGVALPDLIQTSAAINPGNSGGALVNLDGEVVGIPTLAATDPQLGGGQAPGIGFAIPSDTVRTIATQLIEHGRVTRSGRAYLGVRLSTLNDASGAYVAAVVAHGPAARGRLEEGDIIVAFDGHAVTGAADVAVDLANTRPGHRAALRVRTGDGRLRTLGVVLGEDRGS